MENLFERDGAGSFSTPGQVQNGNTLRYRNSPAQRPKNDTQ